MYNIMPCTFSYALSCLFEVKYVNQCLKQINILLTKYHFKTKQNYNHYTEQVSQTMSDRNCGNYKP